MNLLSRTTPVLLSLALLFCLEGKAQIFGSKKIVGSGKLTTETVTTPAYDKVALTGFMDVHLVAGKEGQIKVTAEDNLHQYINIAVTNGTLNIGMKSGFSFITNREIHVTVPFESLSGVRIEGSGDIDTKGAQDVIRSSTFNVSVMGSGAINLKLEVTEKVEANITGLGDITLSGTAQSLQVVIEGSGDFEGFGLSADDVKVAILGSGNIEVTARTKLKATISGLGNIAYKGNPTIERRVEGLGRITRSQ